VLSLKAPFIVDQPSSAKAAQAAAPSPRQRVYMLEHGDLFGDLAGRRLSMLWRSADKAQEAATALKITRADLKS